MLEILHNFPSKCEKLLAIEEKLNELTEKLENVGYESLIATPTKSPSKEKFNVTSRAQFKQVGLLNLVCVC